MTPRTRVLNDLEKASKHVSRACNWLGIEGLDVWKAVAEIQQAEENLAKAREELVQVSREALKRALGDVE